MTEAQLLSLEHGLLWAALGLGVAYGALAQRTHFCTMGALADVLSMGDWSRLRMWALATGSAVLGFSTMVALGWVQAADTVYAGPRLLWASQALGGALFGVGMVLASGCGAKTLVRIGGGNLKSLVVFLVVAVSALATLRGAAALLRQATVDRLALALPAGQDLPTLLGHAGLPGTPGQRALGLGLLVGGGLLAWALARAEGRRAEVLLGGLGTGALVLALWWVSGVWGRVDEHPQTLERAFLMTNSQRMESFSFVAPLAYVVDGLTYASDTSRRLSIGMALVPGVVLGSLAAALAGGRFRWEGFAGVADTARHLAGAVLMGVGGVTAVGCTIGQGISGVSTLALGSFIALAGLVGGALAALRWQVWQLERCA